MTVLLKHDCQTWLSLRVFQHCGSPPSTADPSCWRWRYCALPPRGQGKIVDHELWECSLCPIDILTQWLWRCIMLRQMRESMLHRTLHVRIASDTQKYSVFLFAQMMLCIMMLHNFPRFGEPNIISVPPKGLSVRQLGNKLSPLKVCLQSLL